MRSNPSGLEPLGLIPPSPPVRVPRTSIRGGIEGGGRRGRPVRGSQFRPAPPAGFVPAAPAPTTASLGAFPQRLPAGGTPRKRAGALRSAVASGAPSSCRRSRRTNLRLVRFRRRGVPGGSRGDPTEPPPDNRPAFGVAASPTAAPPTKSGPRRFGAVPPRASAAAGTPPPGRPPRAHPPCTSLRMSW